LVASVVSANEAASVLPAHTPRGLHRVKLSSIVLVTQGIGGAEDDGVETARRRVIAAVTVKAPDGDGVHPLVDAMVPKLAQSTPTRNRSRDGSPLKAVV